MTEPQTETPQTPQSEPPNGWDARYPVPAECGPDLLEPLGENLLIRRCPSKTTTAGGLALPDTAQKILNMAWVWRVGPAVPKGLYKPGDLIVLQGYITVDLPTEICGDRMLIVRYTDVLARLTAHLPKETRFLDPESAPKGTAYHFHIPDFMPVPWNRPSDVSIRRGPMDAVFALLTKAQNGFLFKMTSADSPEIADTHRLVSVTRKEWDANWADYITGVFTPPKDTDNAL